PDVPAARGATGSPRPPTAQLSRGGSRAAARILGAARAFSPLSLVVRAQPYPRARSLHVAAGAISQRRPGLRLFWSPNRISEAARPAHGSSRQALLPDACESPSSAPVPPLYSGPET